MNPLANVTRQFLLATIAVALMGYGGLALRLAAIVAGDGFTVLAIDAAIVVTIDDPALILRQRGIPSMDVERFSSRGRWFPMPEIDDPFYVLPYWLILAVAGPAWFVLHRRHRERRRRVLKPDRLTATRDAVVLAPLRKVAQPTTPTQVQAEVRH